MAGQSCGKQSGCACGSVRMPKIIRIAMAMGCGGALMVFHHERRTIGDGDEMPIGAQVFDRRSDLPDGWQPGNN
jgi:hypothetical protein